jgi:thiamine-monophosphate kinase
MIGDDAALLQVESGSNLVVTTDLLIDEVHFSDRTTTAADVGWRAAAANLSDLAAMGATPTGITVGLGLPGDVSVAWVEQLYQGLTACLNTYNTAIVGGDICRSPVRTVAIAAFGQVNPERVIRRSMAQSGDLIVVTGVHGASRAGLELLLQPDLAPNLSQRDRTTLIQAHQRPIPRFDAIAALHQIFQTYQVAQTNAPPGWQVAGMDSSDGLADAVLQICRASRVGARLDRNQIPLPPVLDWLSSPQALEWALYGGEDFELVLCVPPAIAHLLINALGSRAAIVGIITSTIEVVLSDSQGIFSDEKLTLSRGFQHFH